MFKKILYIIFFSFSTLSYAKQLQCKTQCNKTDDKKITIKEIKLFHSTLEDLYKQFGKASIYSPYENNPRYICYVSDNQNDETAIVFSSYDTVEGVEIYKYKSQILPMLNCTKSRKVSENIAFESGLNSISGKETIEK